MKNRKRNRMFGFDYSQDAIYFVTSCCKNRLHYFGEIVNNEMQLNENGEICQQQIKWLQNQYQYIEIHNFIVMPNHVHILLEINRDFIVRTGRIVVGTGRDLSLREREREREMERELETAMKIKSISSLIGAFKTTTSKKIHEFGNDYFEWQRSFHDHIVRDNKRYEFIFDYITDNPNRWKEDALNTETNPNFKENE